MAQPQLHTHPNVHLFLLSATGAKCPALQRCRSAVLYVPIRSIQHKKPAGTILAAYCSKLQPCSPAVTQKVMQTVKDKSANNLAVWLA